MKIMSKVGGVVYRDAVITLNKNGSADVVLHYDEALDIADDFSIKEE